MKRCLGLIILGAGLASPGWTQRIEAIWPAPNNAYPEGQPIADLLQHAGSGDAESGGFGGVRSGGSQFHEGVDIRATRRDKRGEAADPVSAACDGVVRHISTVPGKSNYGRYIVLEHPTGLGLAGQ
jgi:murein DD-endopeptidase MepM/ murein hydrolase activator NlpD